MSTNVQIAELKKSWVSKAEKMGFVLEMRAKTEDLRYAQYIIKAYHKFVYIIPFQFQSGVSYIPFQSRI